MRWTPERLDEAVRLKQTMTWQAVADHFGVNPNQVRMALRNNQL